MWPGRWCQEEFSCCFWRGLMEQRWGARLQLLMLLSWVFQPQCSPHEAPHWTCPDAHRPGLRASGDKGAEEAPTGQAGLQRPERRGWAGPGPRLRDGIPKLVWRLPEAASGTFQKGPAVEACITVCYDERVSGRGGASPPLCLPEHSGTTGESGWARGCSTPRRPVRSDGTF